MQKKIILQADEPIVCPKCGHQFPLGEGITRQTIERYEEEFEALVRRGREELEAQLAKEADRKAMKATAEQIAKLQEQLGNAKKNEREARDAIEAARAEIREKLRLEGEQEHKLLREEIAAKDAALGRFREQELELRRERQSLIEKQKDLDLEVQRRLDQESSKIAEAAAHREVERFQLRESEYKKKIDDAERAVHEMRRRLEQGSQQLQGEVLELEVEQALTSTFFHDQIEEVKKGARGADVVQTVRTMAGVAAGKIIWEAKRAEHWSDKWLQKLKDDQQEAKADLAVLVTTTLPRGVSDAFMRIGDVWVITPHVLRPVAETLRVILLEAHKLRQANTGRAEKIEVLYNYVASPAFSQRVRSVLESFQTMQQELDSEKRAFQRIWGKRQTQIERVTANMASIVGEMQAIAHNSLPELDDIEAIALPEPRAVGDDA